MPPEGCSHWCPLAALGSRRSPERLPPSHGGGGAWQWRRPLETNSACALQQGSPTLKGRAAPHSRCWRHVAHVVGAWCCAPRAGEHQHNHPHSFSFLHGWVSDTGSAVADPRYGLQQARSEYQTKPGPKLSLNTEKNTELGSNLTASCCW